MLSVLKLKIMLSLLPDDAVVKIRHELVGDDQFAESLYYEKDTNTVWIREMDDTAQRMPLRKILKEFESHV